MRISCNGCRVLRKGCSEDCPIRPCLQWIKNAESQANATVFLAKFYGRAGLMSLISAGPEHLRPAIFRSLLYEACGRMANPVYGAVGLLWSGNWQTCQAAVESILKGCPVHPISPAHVQIPTEERNKTSPPAFPPTPPSPLMQSIAKELHKVKTKGRFKQPKKTCELSKDLTHIVSDAEASQFCNLRWRRCYPGDFEAAPPHRLVSSDSSSETEHCDEVKNNEAGFEPATYKHNPGMDFSNIPCEPAKTQTQASGDCESDLELELTLCCQSPLSHAIEKAPNSCGEHSMPIVTSLGLGLIPIMSDAASCF